MGFPFDKAPFFAPILKLELGSTNPPNPPTPPPQGTGIKFANIVEYDIINGIFDAGRVPSDYTGVYEVDDTFQSYSGHDIVNNTDSVVPHGLRWIVVPQTNVFNINSYYDYEEKYHYLYTIKLTED